MNNAECMEYLETHVNEFEDGDYARLIALCHAEQILLQKHNMMLESAQMEQEYFGLTEDQKHEVEIRIEVFTQCEDAVKSLFEKSVDEIREVRRQKERGGCVGRTKKS